MTFGKNKVDKFTTLKAAKRAQLANKLWETDKMDHEIQGQGWERDFEKAMKV